MTRLLTSHIFYILLSSEYNISVQRLHTLTHGPSPVHSLFLNDSQLWMVFTFLKGRLKTGKKESHGRTCDRDHMYSTKLKFYHLALFRKCLLTAVPDPQIFVKRGGGGGEQDLRVKKKKQIPNKYALRWLQMVNTLIINTMQIFKSFLDFHFHWVSR